MFVFNLYAVKIIVIHMPLRWPHKKKSGRKSSGDLGGHSSCKINWSSKNYHRNPVLVCMVWHVETTNPFHQPPAKQ
jgi:hypothetical protein